MAAESSSFVLVRWLRATGSVEIVDRASFVVFSESGAARIVAGSGGVMWGFTGAYTTPHQTRFAPLHGPARDIRFGGVYHPGILDVGQNHVLFASPDAELGIQQIRRLDLDTDELEDLGALGADELGSMLVVDDGIYGVFRTLGRGFLGHIVRSAPSPVIAIIDVIAPRGVTASAEHLLWIDNGNLHETTTVHRVAFADLQSVETIAHLSEHDAVNAAWNDDALWAAVYPTGDDSQWALTRIDTSGVVSFAVDYRPGELASAGDDGLLVLTNPTYESGERAQLLLQPVR
jgi:hypothetical protein